MALICAPQTSFAQVSVGVAINLAPPPLPVYEQPPLPGPNYIWTPGYWAYAGGDYYWVPGTWVLAPQPGYLWTPGYWAWGPSGYFFHVGYWGPQVGFYGGINYGYGYGGSGYQGGRWDHGVFAYNRSVTHISNPAAIHNVYNERVVNVTNTHVSFNGGNAGVHAVPTAAERQYGAAPHVAPTAEQESHMHAAAADRNQFASVNHGAPSVAATPHPGAMHDAGAVRANAAPHPGPGAAVPQTQRGAPQAHPTPAPNRAAMHPAPHVAAQAAGHPAPHPAPRPAPHPAPHVAAQAAPHPAPHPAPQPAARPAPHPAAHGGGHQEDRKQ